MRGRDDVLLLWREGWIQLDPAFSGPVPGLGADPDEVSVAGLGLSCPVARREGEPVWLAVKEGSEEVLEAQIHPDFGLNAAP